jgi:hypothetical protein
MNTFQLSGIGTRIRAWFTRQRFIDYGKMAAAMALAWFFSAMLVRHVFMNYTPDVRDNFPRYAKLKAEDSYIALLRAIGRDVDRIAETNPTLQDLRDRAEQLAPGVRAAQYENQSYAEVDVTLMEFKTVTVTLEDGTTATASVPRNSVGMPPSGIRPGTEGAESPEEN